MQYGTLQNRRPPVNSISRRANSSARASMGARNSRPHFSGGIGQSVRPISSFSAASRSGRFSQPRPETPKSVDWDAIQEIYLASRPKFVGLAYTILRNREDAEDAVQDAFLSAYRYLSSFEGRSAFTTWFTR